MNFDSVMAAIQDLDRNNSLLIILLGLSSSYFLKELVQPRIWVVGASIPALIGAGYLSVGFMRVNTWFISPDEPVNTIIGAIAGMAICFIIGAVIVKLMYVVTDDTSAGPYKPETEVAKPASDRR